MKYTGVWFAQYFECFVLFLLPVCCFLPVFVPKRCIFLSLYFLRWRRRRLRLDHHRRRCRHVAASYSSFLTTCSLSFIPSFFPFHISFLYFFFLSLCSSLFLSIISDISIFLHFNLISTVHHHCRYVYSYMGGGGGGGGGALLSFSVLVLRSILLLHICLFSFCFISVFIIVTVRFTLDVCRFWVGFFLSRLCV